MPLNSPILSGDISGGLHSTSVDKLKGNTIAAVSPRDGEVLTWNGEAWVPGAPANGGSGGGGVAFYFNGATAAQSPTTGLPGTPVELGRVADTGLTTITSNALSEVTYTLVKGFVSDVLDPSTTTIPAGLWDFNLWAASNANAANQTIFRIQIYKYNGANAPTLLATSDDISIYDPTVAAQYIASVVIPQTTILATDRIYIEVQGRATANNRTITIYTGDAKPSHVHTTIPSVTGTGLVKVVSSVMQSPASLLIDADVASDAAIAQSKISGLTTALDAKAAKTQIQIYNTPGTFSFSKPTNAQQVCVELVSGGNGGGAGGKGTAGTAIFGGSGGGAGGYSRTLLSASDLESTCTVVVGAGGNGSTFGGAAATVGGASSFANASTPTLFLARAQSGGTPGQNGGTTAPTTGTGGAPNSNAGGTANVTGSGGAGSGSANAPTGGGAGGGISAASQAFNGGNGATNPFINVFSAGGGGSSVANGASATSATTRVTPSLVLNGGGGGGGGASSFASGSGGNGANGSGYGTGGGGGGATIGSGNGGNGGNGAGGIVVVTTYF
jgi:hypothetical protein